MRKANGIKEKEAGDSGTQVAMMQSQMNTIKQQSLDKANAYEGRVNNNFILRFTNYK